MTGEYVSVAAGGEGVLGEGRLKRLRLSWHLEGGTCRGVGVGVGGRGHGGGRGGMTDERSLQVMMARGCNCDVEGTRGTTS